MYGTATDPMQMAFAPDGTLFIGRDNIGSGGNFGDAVRVTRIAFGGGSGQEFGTIAVPDPDSIAFDVDGTISGVPGSVLVDGTGGLFAIHPDQSVALIFDVAADINSMAFDSTGRLIMISGPNQIKQSTGSPPALLGPVVTSTAVSMALDAGDDIP